VVQIRLMSVLLGLAYEILLGCLHRVAAGCAKIRGQVVHRIYNVISPHLDDAALSCSLLLAANPGSYVTTVFAGGPSSMRPLTTWDRLAGYFPEGADVVGIRRGEDISASAMVCAKPIHLTYWDRQYRNEDYGYDGVPEAELAPAITAELLSQRPQAPADYWVIPLGLGHVDHRLAAEAGLLLAEREAGEFYVYEELPYSAELKAEVASRKNYFTERGFVLKEDPAIDIAEDRSLKAAVIRCHASQRRLLRRRVWPARRSPERIWRLLRE
jgi:LmbE family N-acetylglucosaminyl deacetylase